LRNVLFMTSAARNWTKSQERNKNNFG